MADMFPKHLFRWAFCRILVICLIFMTADTACAEILRVGFIRVAPHVILNEKEEPEGPAIEYFQDIAQDMGVEASFIRLPVARLLAYLQDGEIDAALILTRSPEREKMFCFPEQPLIRIQPAIVVPRNHPLRAVTSADDLLPLRICGWGNAYRPATMQDSRLNIILLYGRDMVKEALDMVRRGRADAFYSPGSNTLKYELQRENIMDSMRIIPLPDPEVGLYTVFSRKVCEKYLSRYETALGKVSRRKPYEKLMEEIYDRQVSPAK